MWKFQIFADRLIAAGFAAFDTPATVSPFRRDRQHGLKNSLRILMVIAGCAGTALVSACQSDRAQTQDTPPWPVPGAPPSMSSLRAAGDPLGRAYAACNGKIAGTTCSVASPTGQGAPTNGICQWPAFGSPGPLACVPVIPWPAQTASR